MLRSIACALSLTCLLSASASAAAGRDGRIVIVVDQGKAGLVYRIDGIATPVEGVLQKLNDLALSRGNRLRVQVLIHENAPLRVVDDLRGFLFKAGFEDLKWYYFGRTKRYMVELTLATQLVPFSDAGVQ